VDEDVVKLLDKVRWMDALIWLCIGSVGGQVLAMLQSEMASCGMLSFISGLPILLLVQFHISLFTPCLVLHSFDANSPMSWIAILPLMGSDDLIDLVRDLLCYRSSDGVVPDCETLCST